MMKTLILYASKYGYTEKLANVLQRQRLHVDVQHIKSFAKDFSKYDEVIIGTPIYMGKINKHVKKTLDSYKHELSQKELRIFLCGMNNTDEQQVITTNFDRDIINHAKIKYIGGAYQFQKMNFLYKAIVKSIAKTDQDQEVILEQNIEYLLK